jgi:hypothetical protein
MDQDRMDQGWQQLQARIERMLAPSLTADLQNIEYKPRQATPLLATGAEKRALTAPDAR